jgi:hypothetical protein
MDLLALPPPPCRSEFNLLKLKLARPAQPCQPSNGPANQLEAAYDPAPWLMQAASNIGSRKRQRVWGGMQPAKHSLAPACVCNLSLGLLKATVTGEMAGTAPSKAAKEDQEVWRFFH